MSGNPSVVFSHSVSINATDKIDRYQELLVTAHNICFYEWSAVLPD